MSQTLTCKLNRLRNILIGCEQAIIAYSGGVDSTLLLRVACEVLGKENVTAQHAVSCLHSAADHEQAAELVKKTEGLNCVYQTLSLFPLRSRKFTANTDARCYICKLKMYSALLAFRDEQGSKAIVLDGTNFDDLTGDRPGLQALAELSIPTPLADVGLHKNEIRLIAKEMGLPNWNYPSNSCLATRIATHLPISRPLLDQISRAEVFLQQKNFTDCRVKTDRKKILILIRSEELMRCREMYNEIRMYFQNIGLLHEMISIKAYQNH